MVSHQGYAGAHPLGSVDEVAVVVAGHAAHASNSACSARAVSINLSLPWSTARNILHYVIQWYPFKIHSMHQLRLPRSSTITCLCSSFLAHMEVNGMWQGWGGYSVYLRAAFYSGRRGEYPEFSHMGSISPHVVQERLLHSSTVYYEFISSTFGPYFFEDTSW